MKTKLISIAFAMFLSIQTSKANAVATAMLYNGTGSSPTDVIALGNILTSMGISYDLVNSAQLNAMPRTTIASYKLIVMPGGNSIDMGKSLTYAATANVRSAVKDYGISYIGFCAGAFMAESSTMYNVFNLTPSYFDFYNYNVINIVRTTHADGRQRDLVYWQGPWVNGFGTVVAKYPNGRAAIAQGKSGRGYVIVSGVHPEAPADWRYGMSADGDGVEADVNYTRVLINAAITKTALPRF